MKKLIEEIKQDIRDLREADISYLIDKSLRPIIDDNKFENVEIDVVDITESIEK